MTNGVDQDKVDGVKDLIDYVEKHGPEVTGMKEDIAGNTKAIADEVKRAADEEARLAGLIGDNADAIADEIERADTEEKRLAGLIKDNADAIEDNANAIAALGITDGKVANATMADKANSLTDAAKEEVKGVKVNNAANADKADSLTDNAKEEVKAVKVDNATHADNADKLGGVAATDYALKTDAQNYANTAETNANAYADSLAGNYATAAQGAKADSALQNIEVGTGLKVSEKANNKQTIEIDTDVVFVFKCGSASVLVD